MTGPAQAADASTAWHALSIEDALAAQKVDPAKGLSAAEVEARRAKYGANRFAEQKTEPRWHAFLRQYKDAMQIVLLVAGILSIYPVKQVSTGVMLILLTVFNAYLGLSQEGKAAAAVAALQKMMIVKSRVRRDGELEEVAADELVPGDIVSFEAGDLISADGRIIAAATLEIDEAALTGESLPTSKLVDAVAPDAPLGDHHDMAFMNTNVTRGSGQMVVTSTGMSTEVGHISGMLQVDKGQETPLTRQINTLTNQLLVIAGLALLASISIGYFIRGDSFNTLFVTAIAFAVSAIPTGLPAVITTILSYGTQTLAKAHAIVKQLRSVETLGSTSAINSDKTGTLTLNKMTAVEMAIPGRRYTISGTGYGIDGIIARVGGDTDVPLDAFLLPCVLAADAVVKDGDLIGDPTEGALVVLAEKGGVSAVATREAYPRVATLPFDAAYKMMATFHAMKDEAGKDVVRGFIKGAPDQLLARGATVITPDLSGTTPVDESMKQRFLDENERLGAKGLRVMATGRKDFDPSTFDPDADLLPLLDGMTLLALVGHRRSAAAVGQAVDRGGARRRHPGPHDHRRPCGHGRGDRQGPGHPRPRDHRRRVPGDERRRGDRPDRRHRRDRPGDPGGQGPPGRHPAGEGPHRRHDRRRRERRPGPQEGRHRRRDGHHRHRGLEGGRGHDPDRRRLLDHRQGRRARPGPVRQPQEVHPVPGRPADRLHLHVPRLEHPQRARRRAVLPAPDAVHELHGPGVPVRRPRLRRAVGGAHGAQAASEQRGAPQPAPALLAGRRGRRHGPQHAGRPLLGEQTPTRTTSSHGRWA